MGQCASKRHSKSSKLESKKSKKEASSSATKVWMIVNTQEFEALQKSASKSQQDIDKLRSQYLCQSIVIKEILEDILKIQKNENEELKQRIQKLETTFAASTLAKPSSTSRQ